MRTEIEAVRSLEVRLVNNSTLESTTKKPDEPAGPIEPIEPNEPIDTFKPDAPDEPVEISEDNGVDFDTIIRPGKSAKGKKTTLQSLGRPKVKTKVKH